MSTYTMRTRGLKRRVMQVLPELPAGQSFTETDLLPRVREVIPLADAAAVRTTLYRLASEGVCVRDGALFRRELCAPAPACGSDAIERALAALAAAEAAIRELQAEAARLQRVREVLA